MAVRLTTATGAVPSEESRTVMVTSWPALIGPMTGASGTLAAADVLSRRMLVRSRKMSTPASAVSTIGRGLGSAPVLENCTSTAVTARPAEPIEPRSLSRVSWLVVIVPLGLRMLPRSFLIVVVPIRLRRSPCSVRSNPVVAVVRRDSTSTPVSGKTCRTSKRYAGVDGEASAPLSTLMLMTAAGGVVMPALRVLIETGPSSVSAWSDWLMIVTESQVSWM